MAKAAKKTQKKETDIKSLFEKGTALTTEKFHALIDYIDAKEAPTQEKVTLEKIDLVVSKENEIISAVGFNTDGTKVEINIIPKKETKSK